MEDKLSAYFADSLIIERFSETVEEFKEILSECDDIKVKEMNRIFSLVSALGRMAEDGNKMSMRLIKTQIVDSLLVNEEYIGKSVLDLLLKLMREI